MFNTRGCVALFNFIQNHRSALLGATKFSSNKRCNYLENQWIISVLPTRFFAVLHHIYTTTKIPTKKRIDRCLYKAITLEQGFKSSTRPVNTNFNEPFESIDGFLPLMSEDGFTVTSEVSTSEVIDVHMSCKAVTRRKGVHSGLSEVFEEDHRFCRWNRSEVHPPKMLRRMSTN